LTADEQSKRLALSKRLREPSKLRLEGDLAALHDIECERYNPNSPLAKLMGYSSKGADQVGVQFVRKDSRVRESEYAGVGELYDIFPRQLHKDHRSKKRRRRKSSLLQFMPAEG
jgi:hypothetical protein